MVNTCIKKYESIYETIKIWDIIRRIIDVYFMCDFTTFYYRKIKKLF